MIRAFGYGVVVVLVGAMVGCAPRPMVQQKSPPPDPLLVTRKPIEGTQRDDDASRTARLQPPAPPALAGDLSPRDGPSVVQPVQLHLDPPRADAGDR